MPGRMKSKRERENAAGPSINKGIEVMLPRRSRRVEEEPPSWFDRTFHVHKWSVRVKINIDRREQNGN
jgi:hypothetical protein